MATHAAVRTGGGTLLSACPFCGSTALTHSRYLGRMFWIATILTIGFFAFVLPFLPVKATCQACRREWIGKRTPGARYQG